MASGLTFTTEPYRFISIILRCEVISRQRLAVATLPTHRCLDQRHHRLSSIAVLPELLVHFQPHPQAVGAGYLITSGKKRAHGSECIRTFTLHPLATVLELEAALRIVIVKCVASDELESLLLGYIGGLLPDHYG